MTNKSFNIFLGFILLGGCFLPCFSQVDHYESVILPGDNWTYLVPNEQPSAAWKELSFDDTSWPQGPSGIGYGDDDDATIINTTLSVYMRRSFMILDKDDISSLILHMDYDDGFVAYFNGTEIARALVSGDIPAFDQPSDGLHEAMLYRGLTPESWEVDLSLLQNGENILTVEVHNQSTTSSDLSALPVLSVGIISDQYQYRPTPEWFVPPAVEVDFESSNLPVVIIETNGNEIVDEPKIDASMKIIERENGERNFLDDQNNASALDYDGQIKIEIRGSSSQILPKKQFGFTTYNAQNEKDNVSLLGMPSENDWQLNALAFDPSLMRDYISYRLAEKIGNYASRGRYCEVILNGSYHGLYILQEKLKADKDRIDINKIEPSDNEGKKLTGGYITKTDKVEGQDLFAWGMANYNGFESRFVHEHPRPLDVTPAQNDYIRSEFFRLQNNVRNTSPAAGYPSVIDVPSFIDFILINELASNADAYEFSTYFHKDRNGKLRAGPVWDFNLTYGNDLFFWGFDRSQTDRWQLDDGENSGPKFWSDLFYEETFRCYLKKRWDELTQAGSPLHPDQIAQMIDETVSLISEAKDREELRWRTVGDHAAHIAEMKSWIIERVNWMTDNLGSASSCEQEDVPQLVISKINYHPRSEDGKGEKDLEFIEITNLASFTVDLTGIYFGGTGLVYQFPAGASVEAGSSIYLANETDEFREAYGFEPYDEFSRSLSNAGQEILLLNAMGNEVDLVTYSDQAPWPTSADGSGDFLSLIDPQSDNNNPSNWEALSPEVILNSQHQIPVLHIYPNPSDKLIFIESAREILSVRLYSLSGQKAQLVLPEEGRYVIKTSSFNSGTYIAEIQTINQIYYRRIIIR